MGGSRALFHSQNGPGCVFPPLLFPLAEQISLLTSSGILKIVFPHRPCLIKPDLKALCTHSRLTALIAHCSNKGTATAYKHDNETNNAF